MTASGQTLPLQPRSIYGWNWGQSGRYPLGGPVFTTFRTCRSLALDGEDWRLLNAYGGADRIDDTAGLREHAVAHTRAKREEDHET